MKFETARIDECIDFIEAKGLHHVSGAAASGGDAPDGKVRVVATGGGAYKYADIFQARTACSWEPVWNIPKHPQGVHGAFFSLVCMKCMRNGV